MIGRWTITIHGDKKTITYRNEDGSLIGTTIRHVVDGRLEDFETAILRDVELQKRWQELHG